MDIDSDSSEGTSRPACLGEEKEENFPAGKSLDSPVQDGKAVQTDQGGLGGPQDTADVTEDETDNCVRERSSDKKKDKMEISGNHSGNDCNDLKSVMDQKSKEVGATKEGHSTREPSAKGYFAIETLPTMEVSAKELSLKEVLEKEAHAVDQHVESSRHAENLSKQLEKAHRHSNSKGGECRGRGDVGLQIDAGSLVGVIGSNVGPVEVWAPRTLGKPVQGGSARREKREDERTMRRTREGGHRRRDEDSEEEALLRREEKERLRDEWGGTIRRRGSGKRRGGGEEENVRRREEDSTTLHRRREERRREEEVGTIRKREEGGSHRREKRREEENGTLRRREESSGSLRRWEEEEKLRLRRDEEGTLRRRENEGTVRRQEGENTLRRREDEGTLRRREEEGCVRRRRSSVKDVQRHEEDRQQVEKKTAFLFLIIHLIINPYS